MEAYGYYFNKLPKIAQLKTLQLLEKEAVVSFNLDRTVAELAAQWKLTLGKVLKGGTASLIIEATRENGQEAVLKIALPGSNIWTEALVLRVAKGNGYVNLYEVDFSKEAILLERLGTPLSGTSKTIDEHIVTICKVLTKAWVRPNIMVPLPTAAQKALEMKEIVKQKWSTLHKPFSEQTLQLAIEYAQARMEAYDPENCVLAHGDAHGFNLMETENDTYKLIDPDGIYADKAYDLICIMRDWSDGLLRGNTLELLLARCHWVHELTGVDKTSIWQWGFLGRLMIGITLLELGNTHEGKQTLEVADRISHYRLFRET
ncbi:aminoglycoside phosphotransferase family protein [uncultured Kordia sp.]|uniref:aminoglycoside phosphotransferase family protein n=1 Tax=uncultured Kordia sp. TaxID=507699 RepID=UPI00261818D0|nr:aminoglycoside phosphotransferase family protein [uncultured Kordia sp.]